MPATIEWNMPSNSGRSEIKFRAATLHKSTHHIEFSIELTGQAWSHAGLKADPPVYDLIDDFRCNLPCVWIPRPACEDLLSDFETWLRSHTPFTRTLSLAPDPRLIVQIDEREEVVRSRDHPTFTFYYDRAGWSLEMFFQVDQSCIRIARDGLSAILATYNGKGQ
jgi:hypothetical protein